MEQLRAVIFVLIQFLTFIDRCVQSEDTAQTAQTSNVPLSVQGYKLTGFTYKIIRSVSSLTCSQRCLSEFPKCRSYNHFSSMTEFVCELSSKGISSMAEGVAGQLEMEPNYAFVQLQSADMDYPSTCADHYRSGNRLSGLYYVRYGNDIYYQVYCDMHSETNKVYTLIVSWSFKNKGTSQFRNIPYYLDNPLKEDEPNWEYYRMSLARMKYISTRSTHWRITCNFPQEGLVYIDYVRGKISAVDFLTFKGWNICKEIEHINVRGRAKSNLTVAWWQDTNAFVFHHDSSLLYCDFGITSGAVGSEDDFGFYDAPNPKFRCCNSDSSNTNVWLGKSV